MGKQQIEKTWRDWNDERIGGIEIIDPDGFDRGDPMMNKYVYSLDEFLRRRTMCTVRGFVSPLRRGTEHAQRV